MAETKQQRADRIRREDAAAKQAERDAATRRAEADARARQAEADSRAATAKAEAEARSRQIEADARMRQADAEAKAASIRAEQERAARAAEAAPYDRARALGLNIGAMVAGATIGGKLAKGIEQKHAAGVTAANKQLAAVAKEARGLMKSAKPSPVALAKLAAVVSTADGMRLAKRPAALGLTTAGMLLAEGGFARFVLAPGAEGPAKEVLQAAGTASAFAATSLIGKRLLANATTPNLPAARDVAAVDAARKFLGAKAPAAPTTVAQSAANVVKMLPKSKAAGLAVAATAIGAMLATKASAAEPSKSGEAEKPKTAGGDLVDAFFHSGVAAASLSVVKESGSKLVKAGAGAAGVVNAALALGSLTSAAQKMGASQKDVADVATGALSTVATASSAKILLSPAARLAAGVVSKAFVPLTVLSAAVGAYQGAQKDGVRGAIYGAADSLTGGLVSLTARKTGFTDSPALDLMREAAAKTASDMGKAQTVGVAVGGQGPEASDGMTKDYYRLQAGQRVHVTSYKTPTR